MKTKRMNEVFSALCAKLGESYARIRFQWLCQKYDVMQWDECPDSMYEEVIRTNNHINQFRRGTAV